MLGEGFTSKDTKTLLKVRKNLLQGLTEVQKSILDGSFNTVGTKGGAPPSQSGQLTLALLIEIQHVLTDRGHSLTW